MSLDPAIQTFLTESTELLEAMEASLLRLEDTPDDADLLNAVFRAAHTIKGSAGLFGFDPIVAFTHEVESALDRIRAGKVAFSADLGACLLRCGDHMRALLEHVRGGETLPNADVDGPALLAELQRLTGASVAPSQHSLPTPQPATTEQTAAPEAGESTAATDLWHISLRFGTEVLRNGMDPLSFLRYLNTLGDIAHVTTLLDAMPELAQVDPECCYLGLEIAFSSQADKATIENVFEFVRDDCRIQIIPPRSKVSAYIDLIEALPEATERLGEILVRTGALTQSELGAGLQRQEQERSADCSGDAAASATPLGAILVQQGAVESSVVSAALDKQRQTRDRKSEENRSVRVDADKLDQLIDLVGELVIAGAGSQLLARRAGQNELVESLSTLARLVEEVRDRSLGLRMVQIGGTFQRFQRVVREVSRELGKDVTLAISGAETELDKSVVERIGDPLMHLVRNAMDHGIESPDVRVKAGKAARATLSLHAYHDSGSIVIEVSDDGAGLNRDRILSKAMERGLVVQGTALSDAEVFNLIFEPGFSTADKLSNLSGRGVGMDVVRRNVEALRGTVQLESQLGKGTVVRIRLPLTLAIIDGFLVDVAHSHYVIPLDMMVECLECGSETRTVARRQGYIDLRGEVLPVLWLRDLFDIESDSPARENIVVIQFGAQKAGLVVDALLGEAQTVIKPLSKLFARVKGISGSSILGSGDVALILDVPGLMQCATERAHQEQISIRVTSATLDDTAPAVKTS